MVVGNTIRALLIEFGRVRVKVSRLNLGNTRRMPGTKPVLIKLSVADDGTVTWPSDKDWIIVPLMDIELIPNRVPSRVPIPFRAENPILKEVQRFGVLQCDTRP